MAQVNINGPGSNADWGVLPLHLLDDIMAKVMNTTKDYLQLQVVCSSWRSLLQANDDHKELNKEIPMLLMPFKADRSQGLLYDIASGKFLKCKLQVPLDNQRFAGSSLGWLVSVNPDYKITLHKPNWIIEGEPRTTYSTSISLAPLLDPVWLAAKFDYPDYSIRKACISADPVTNTNQCIFMVIMEFGGKLAYIRPCRDKTWTRIDSNLSFEDVIFYNDRFWGLTSLGMFVSIEVKDEPFNCYHIKEVTPESPYLVQGNKYIVELNGKLVQVTRSVSWIRPDGYSDRDDSYESDNGSDREDSSDANDGSEADNGSERDDSSDANDSSEADNGSDAGGGLFPYSIATSRETREVEVLEFDHDIQQWICVDNLGGLALFLGDNSSMSVLASKFTGCKSNCIYFTHDTDANFSSREVVDDLCVYDYVSETIEVGLGLDLDVDNLKGELLKRLPIWILHYSL